MHLIQILLPLRNAAGQPFDRQHFAALEHELTDRFSGLTAYTRAPADGFWEEQPGHTVCEQVVVYEVMADGVDRDWWVALRRRLEVQFAQDEIVIRAQEIQRL